MMRLINQLMDRAPFLAFALVPPPVRRRACENRGTHHPVLVDSGRAKLCCACMA